MPVHSSAGFDWIVIDLEHSMISLEVAGELIRVIDLAGVPPLVRLTSNHPDQIKRVMDAGAHGIIVPMVNEIGDAQKALEAIHREVSVSTVKTFRSIQQGSILPFIGQCNPRLLPKKIRL